MIYRVEFQPPAILELQKAHDWYELQRQGLGVGFLRAVAAAVEQLARDPLRQPFSRGNFRRVQLRRFPYTLHYDLQSDLVRVESCLHFRQSPARWPGA